MTEAERRYREDKEYINYSLLKELSEHPKRAKAYLDGAKKETTALTEGSLIDKLLTAPEEVENNIWKLKYKLTEDGMKWCRAYVSIYNPEEEEVKLVVRAKDNAGVLGQCKKEETIYNYWTDAHREYVRAYSNAGTDHLLINTEIFDYYNTTCNRVRDKFPTIFSDSSQFQVPLFEEITLGVGILKNIKLKCLCDIINVDHVNKIIYIIDVKSYESSFIKNYLVYKYYYQGSLYKLIGSYNLPKSYPGYKVEFRFLTIDKSGFNEPELWKLPDSHSSTALYGGLLNNYNVKGIVQLVEEFNYRKSSGNWSDDIEMLKKGYREFNF